MSSLPHEVPSIQCQRCGAGFSIATLAPTIACPYCHGVQPLPPALLHQLGQYQHDMAALAMSARASDEAAMRARLAQAEPGVLYRKGIIIGNLVVFGPMFLLRGAAWILREIGSIPEETQRDIKSVADWISWPFIVAGLVGYRGYLQWQEKSARRSPTVLSMEAVVCQRCGAPNTLQPGQVVRTCRYCRSALVPTHTVIRRAISAAEAEARRARMHRYRAERATRFAVGLPAHILSLVAKAMLIPIAIGAGHYIPVIMLRESPDLAPYAQMVTITGWILAGLVVTGIVMIMARMHEKQTRWATVFAALAGRLGGQCLDQAMFLRWLDTYWAGPLPFSARQIGPYGGAVAAMLNGFPALVIVDLDPINEHDHPVVNLLLGATFAGRWRSPHDAPSDWLYNYGFSVDDNEGGLVASMNNIIADMVGHEGVMRIERLTAHPEETLRLAEVLGALARLAAVSGGSPVAAM